MIKLPELGQQIIDIIREKEVCRSRYVYQIMKKRGFQSTEISSMILALKKIGLILTVRGTTSDAVYKIKT